MMCMCGLCVCVCLCLYLCLRRADIFSQSILNLIFSRVYLLPLTLCKRFYERQMSRCLCECVSLGFVSSYILVHQAEEQQWTAVVLPLYVCLFSFSRFHCLFHFSRRRYIFFTNIRDTRYLWIGCIHAIQEYRPLPNNNESRVWQRRYVCRCRRGRFYSFIRSFAHSFLFSTIKTLKNKNRTREIV